MRLPQDKLNELSKYKNSRLLTCQKDYLQSNAGLINYGYLVGATKRVKKAQHMIRVHVISCRKRD